MSATQPKNTIERWLNVYQFSALLARPRKLVVEAGRRGGKTEEIAAERSIRAMMAMPGSSGTLSARSYSKMLDHMIPSLIAGWQKRGWVEDEDFVVAKAPPKHFLKRPIIAPKKWDHYILTRWGSGCHIISFDHGVTSNSLSTDWALIDEAKQIDPERVKAELFKTLSGHRSIRIDKNTVWGDLPEHLSLTLLTDKFIGKNDYRWVNDYKKDSLSEEEFYKLVMLAKRVQDHYDPYLERELWERQKAATYYMAYSSRASLPAIGIDYYKDQYKNSSNIEFRTSILNEDVKEIEGGFYKLLDENQHTYEARNNSRIDTIGISNYLKGKQKNSLLDNDYRSDVPIKLSIDYGSEFSWSTVYQAHSNTYYLIKNFWSEAPRTFKDMVEEFCLYYQTHKEKVIHLYDDPSGHKKNTEQKRDVDAVITLLKKHGWFVIHKNPTNRYIPHRVKYRIWEMILDERPERNPKAPKFKLNMNNAYETFWSMSKAPVKMSKRDSFEKDKSSENKNKKEEWKATHLSDAADNPICFDFEHLIEGDKWGVTF